MSEVAKERDRSEKKERNINALSLLALLLFISNCTTSGHARASPWPRVIRTDRASLEQVGIRGCCFWLRAKRSQQKKTSLLLPSERARRDARGDARSPGARAAARPGAVLSLRPFFWRERLTERERERGKKK